MNTVLDLSYKWEIKACDVRVYFSSIPYVTLRGYTLTEYFREYTSTEFFFFFFFNFFGPLPRHMEVPGLGVESEL